MDMFLITKIPVYILFNPCEKVTQCACARLVAHEYQGPPNLLRMRKQVWIFNGRRNNQAYARNTKQHIVNVCKLYLETLWCSDNSLVWEKQKQKQK